MAKLVNFWYERSKLMRASIVWVVIIQLVRVLFWYFTQNVSMSSIQTATVVDTIFRAIGYLEILLVVLAVFGVVTETSKKREKKEAPVNMGDGIYMIKK